MHSSAANASANGNQASAGLHHPFRTDQAAAQKQPHTQLWQSRTARPGLGAYDLWHPLTSGSTSFVRMPSPNGGSAALSVQRFNHAALPATQAAAAAQRSSISSVLAQTVKAEGPQGIYRGIAPTLAGILPYAGLKFYVYQSLKQYYRRAGEHAKDRLPIAVMLSFGASAGLVAQTITYPLDVVRRQMQVCFPTSPIHKSDIYNADGQGLSTCKGSVTRRKGFALRGMLALVACGSCLPDFCTAACLIDLHVIYV